MKIQNNARSGDSRRFTICVATTTLLLSLGMPGPVGWWPLLFFALMPMLWLVTHETPGRCALAGFVTGFMYHLVLLYWLIIVLGRYGGLPPWISVPVLMLLAAYMSCFMALFCRVLAFFMARRRRVANPTVFLIWTAPLVWTALDWVRGWLLSGFPWMDLGYGLYTQPLLIQAADLGGHYLITFYLVMVNALCLWLLAPRADIISRPGIFAVACPAAATLLLALIAAYSLSAREKNVAATTGAPKVRVAVAQGNILQDEKWSAAKKQSTIDTYVQLSREVVEKESPLLVVWPETALPFYPQIDPLGMKVARFVDQRDLWLLTGAPYYTLENQGERPVAKYYNSALLINDSGELAGRYDKRHLVPFGEYVPLKPYLPFLAPVVEAVGDFFPGESAAPLVAGSIKMGVLICFESIFPELAAGRTTLGANILVNITNDAWYGRSSAPVHTLAMSVLRAVENRRALVRAANTGISCFVDPDGAIRVRSSLFAEAALTAEVPLLENLTFYNRAGRWFAPLCALLVVFIPVWGRRRPPR